MWCVTVCRGDYRLPVHFSSRVDAENFIESILSCDEHKEITVIITTREVE